MSAAEDHEVEAAAIAAALAEDARRASATITPIHPAAATPSMWLQAARTEGLR